MSDFEKLNQADDRTYTLSTPEGAHLRPCLYCGSEEMVLMGRCPMYGISGAWVRCRHCGARGPIESVSGIYIKDGRLCTPLTAESVEKGKAEAIKSWNMLASLRTRKAREEVPA